MSANPDWQRKQWDWEDYQHNLHLTDRFNAQLRWHKRFENPGGGRNGGGGDGEGCLALLMLAGLMYGANWIGERYFGGGFETMLVIAVVGVVLLLVGGWVLGPFFRSRAFTVVLVMVGGLAVHHAYGLPGVYVILAVAAAVAVLYSVFRLVRAIVATRLGSWSVGAGIVALAYWFLA